MTKRQTHISMDAEVFDRLDALAKADGLDRSGMIARLAAAESERRATMALLAEASPLSAEQVTAVWFSLPPDVDAAPYRRAARVLYPSAERMVRRQRREYERSVEIEVAVRGDAEAFRTFATQEKIRRLAEDLGATS